METGPEYIVQCWNCLGEFDAVAAVWCGCSSLEPTKVCPFCMSCFCGADPLYVEHFWEEAPDVLETQRGDLGKARKRLGDLLLEEGVVDEEQLAEALERIASSNERIGEALVALGAIDPETLARYLERHQGSFAADLSHASIDPTLVQRVGVDLCYERWVIPLEVQELGTSSILTLAMADPGDGRTVEEVGRRTGCRVIGEFAEKADIQEVLRNTFPRAEGTAPGTKDVRKALLSWVARAVREKASHLHVRSERLDLRVYLRIDGVVYEIERYPKKYQPYIVREIRRLVHHPEGKPFARGRIYVRVGGRRHQLTVRARETEHGNDIAVRVVDTETFGRDLQAEAPDENVREAFALSVHRPGLTIISSPLYQGRLDTAYALLWMEKEVVGDVVAFEAQMACPLPGVRQEEIEPEELPGRLRSLEGDGPVFVCDLLRRSNLVSVLEAARRRPVVATTVARGIVPLLEWLFEAAPGERLAEVLHLLTGQRQVPRLCSACRVEDPQAGPSTYAGMDLTGGGALQAMKAEGCDACAGRGHKGHLTLYEILPIAPPVDTLLHAAAAPEVIFQEGMDKGAVTLRASFVQAVTRGLVSFAELERRSQAV